MLSSSTQIAKYTSPAETRHFCDLTVCQLYIHFGLWSLRSLVTSILGPKCTSISVLGHFGPQKKDRNDQGSKCPRTELTTLRLSHTPHTAHTFLWELKCRRKFISYRVVRLFLSQVNAEVIFKSVGQRAGSWSWGTKI